jgi:hypothetical protein
MRSSYLLLSQARSGRRAIRFGYEPEPAPKVPTPSRHPSRALPPPEQHAPKAVEATPRSLAGKTFKGALIPEMIRRWGENSYHKLNVCTLDIDY